MATWNHRVMKRTVDGETFYAVHEVFYEENGKISWTEEPVSPCGETLEELKVELDRYHRAAEQPILNYDELAKEYE